MANSNGNETLTCDVVVMGAGLVGLAAVVALAQQGKRVVLVDAKKKNSEQEGQTWDSRIYALTPSTEAWLQSLGVWPLVNQLRINDVKTMALWNAQSEIPLNLFAEDANLTKLACIVENKNLMQALWYKVDALDVPVIIENPCCSIERTEEAMMLNLKSGSKVVATLLVAADGANSYVRQQLAIATKVKTFNQTALVANYLADKNHEDVARQWFAAHETLALLPLPQKHVSMVWSVSTELAKALLSLTSDELAQRVQEQSDHMLGSLKPVSDTLAFELRQVTASKLIAERVVLIGDAGHQVHPMAGQGANLGFRDVMALQKIINNSHPLHDIGDEIFLRKYERVRKSDILSMNTLTSGLDSWFSKESIMLREMTGWGLRQLNAHRSFKKLLIKQAVA